MKALQTARSEPSLTRQKAQPQKFQMLLIFIQLLIAADFQFSHAFSSLSNDVTPLKRLSSRLVSTPAISKTHYVAIRHASVLKAVKSGSAEASTSSRLKRTTAFADWAKENEIKYVTVLFLDAGYCFCSFHSLIAFLYQKHYDYCLKI